MYPARRIFAALLLIGLVVFVPGQSQSAPAADCSSVISQANSNQGTTVTNVNAWASSAGSWILNPLQRGSTQTQAAIAAGETARQSLETFQGLVSQVAQKDCGQSTFESLYTSLKSQAARYNNTRENIKDPGSTGGDSAPYQNTSAFSTATITYAAAVTDPTATQCATLFSQLSGQIAKSEQQLQLLEQSERVHNSDNAAEYKSNVEPTEVQATTKWQQSNNSLQEAARLGCDKANAETFQGFRDSIKNQADRINSVRDKLAKARLSVTATIDQTARNVADQFKTKTCEDCQKAKKGLSGVAGTLIGSIFESLCCLLSEFVQQLQKAMVDIAERVGNNLLENT